MLLLKYTTPAALKSFQIQPVEWHTEYLEDILKFSTAESSLFLTKITLQMF